MYSNYKIEHVSDIGVAQHAAFTLRKDMDRDQEIAWIQALRQAGQLNPWEKKPRRKARPKWKAYLEEADTLLSKPRKPLPKDVVKLVLDGDIGCNGALEIDSNKTKVLLFVSSTFTDTLAERNALMRDVYPYLRTLCRRLGLEFGTVDMRWGVGEEMSNTHATSDMCLQQIQRCVDESAGPGFMTILGDKYGSRPFPAKIEKQEFECILQELKSQKQPSTILEEWFRVDTNAVPPNYVLQPKDNNDKDWMTKFETMQRLLRQAAQQCLTPEAADKYFISVTENEIKHGLLSDAAERSAGIAVTRQLANLHHHKHAHRHVLDLRSDQSVDTDAQQRLNVLKEKKLPRATASVLRHSAEYEQPSIKAVLQEVKNIGEQVCEDLVTGIFKNYEDNLHVEQDILYEEVLQHRSMAIEKYNSFVGREDLLREVTTAMGDLSEERAIICIHGNSGCGKTALMGKTAHVLKTSQSAQTVLVIRFVGTTSRSSSARAVLRSICEQITRAYGNDTATIPLTYKDLIEHFRECLGYATADRPLVVLIDSLDQLSSEDFGKNLKWLPLYESVPKHCRVIVSTLPGECLDVIRGLRSKVTQIRVDKLSAGDGPQILDQMLAAAGRTVTVTQRQLILGAFSNCALPLYLRLATDIALQWHSYDDVSKSVFAPDMPGLITKLFERLELLYGEQLVQNALGYITAAKGGLSEQELEDILSCDDALLDSVFVWFTPPLRRVPPLLWIRVRHMLGQYLVERGSDGVTTYGWYHRQFWETAEKRYLGAFRTKAHLAIADYFEGKYVGGKWFTPTSKARDQAFKTLEPEFGDRHLNEQPLVITGTLDTTRVFNKRKLSELSYNILKAQDWDRFEQILCDLEFVEAKFAAGQGHACLSEFMEASKLSNNKTITTMARFIGAGLSFLIRESRSIYQLASQQVEHNVVYEIFAKLPKSGTPALMSDHNRVEVEDPCQMTMTGHTSSIRVCEFSPDGSLIASSSEDSSLRLWDAYSGAEVVTVTDLPGPFKGQDTADVGSGFRPCAFTRDGSMVLTGSEDGHVQAWNLKGALVQEYHIGNNSGIVGLCVSPDGVHFATANRDSKLRIFTLDNGIKEVHSVGTPNPSPAGLGCEYSPDGSRIAMSCYSQKCAIVLVDTHTGTLIAAGEGHTTNNICLAYSPDGRVVATGGDNCSISLYDAGNAQKAGFVAGHRGWIWCLRYNQSGSLLFSCSSDRTLKVWETGRYSCLASLGGHLHRVSWVSLRPNLEDVFVTGSLDYSLKIWDTEAVVANRVPPVGGLHYTTLKVSPSRRYMATSQGWMTNCTFTDIASEETVAHTPDHPGFIQHVTFIPGTEQLVCVDTGHKGSYEASMAQYAEVSVTDPARGTLVTLTDLDSPCRVAATDKHIFTGSINGVVHAYNVGTFDRVGTLKASDDGIMAMAASPRARDLAVGTGNRILIFDSRCICTGFTAWATAEHDVIQTLLKTSLLPFAWATAEHDVSLRVCTYSPDGRHLASGTYNGSMYVWDADQSYALLFHIQTHFNEIKDMEYSPNGAYLATACADRSLRIWEVTKDYSQKVAFFGPTSQLGFIDNTTLIVGQASGNRKRLSFET